MDDQEFQKFKQLFITTANDYIEKIDSAVANGEFVSNAQVVIDLHIQTHALKGQSYAMQFISLAHAAKMLESVFKLMKDGELHLDAPQISEIRILLRVMQECVRTIKETDHENDLTTAMKNFQKVFPNLDLLNL